MKGVNSYNSTIRYKSKWNEGLKLQNMEDHSKNNEDTMKELCNLAKIYSKWIDDEMKKTKQELVVSTVGKQDPKRHLLQVFLYRKK